MRQKETGTGTSLARTKQELGKIRPRLSLDSVLAQGLNQVSLLYKTEMLPGEVRIWQKSFDGERPEMVEWAFTEYFRTGVYPPKPADISELIRNEREHMLADNPPDQGATRREEVEKWRNSPEFKKFVDEATERINKAFAASKVKPFRKQSA